MARVKNYEIMHAPGQSLAVKPFQ